MDVDFDDDTPNRCTTLVYYAWKIFTCLFLHVLLVTMVVLYCLLGAITFERLEKAHEIEVRETFDFRAQKHVYGYIDTGVRVLLLRSFNRPVANGFLGRTDLYSFEVSHISRGD